MNRLFAVFALAAVLAGFAGSHVRAEPAADCFGEDLERRIEGCTALIERRDQSVADLSFAYAMRALAYSLKGRYATAIHDYDMAISHEARFRGGAQQPRLGLLPMGQGRRPGCRTSRNRCS